MPTRSQKKSPAAKTIGGKRRLLVVGAGALAEELCATLIRLGNEVLGNVTDSAATLALTRDHVPDLAVVLVSAKAPTFGIELARELRDAAACATLLIVERFDADLLRAIKESEPDGLILGGPSDDALFLQTEVAIHRRQLQQERDRLRPAIQKADAKLKAMAGVIPICAGCKKIHEDGTRWTKLEEYFARHAGIEFTHGFCPSCENRLYGTNSRGPIPPGV